MPVAAIAGIGSALIGASASRSAAKAQSRAADQQYQLQKDIYEDTKGRFQPYEQAGNNALAAYLYEMGLGPAPTVGGTTPSIETVTVPGGGGPGQAMADLWPFRSGYPANRPSASRTLYRVGGKDFSTMEEAQAWADANKTGGSPYGGFTATPGYDFRLQSGQDSINALAGARGGLFSGKTLQDLSKFNQNIASDEYGAYLGRLGGLVDMGQASAGNQAQAGNAFAAGASNALAAKGNAASAGAIGVNNALQQGLQTGLGLHMYQQGVQQPYNPLPGATISGWRP